MVVDIIGHIAVDRFACIVAIGEGNGAQTVALRLLRNVACEYSRMIAVWQRSLGMACLACHIGDVGSHVKHIVAARMLVVSVGDDDWHFHFEFTCSRGLHGIVQYCLLTHFASHASPEHCRTANYAQCHTGVLHWHSGKAAGCALKAYGVACGILVGRLCYIYAECRTLVFLYPNRGIRVVAIVGTQGVSARHSTLRQYEVGACHTVFVGLNLLRSHLLVVGIAQGNGHRLTCLGLTLIHLIIICICHGSHMQRLSGSVDAAVGEQRRAHYVCLVAVIMEMSRHRGEGESTFGVGVYAVRARFALGVCYVSLAVAVAGVCAYDVLAVLVNIGHDVNLGSRHCHTACGVEHSHTVLVAGQRLYDGIDVAYAQQLAVDGHADVIGRHLYEIHSRTQSLYFERVANGLVCRQTYVSTHVGDRLFVLNNVSAQACIVLVARRIERCGAVNVESRHGDTQFADVVECHHLHLARHSRQSQFATYTCVKRWQGKAALGVAQNIHTWPGSPLHEGVVDVVHLLLGGYVLCVSHIGVAFNGNFGTRHQVGIFAHERIERHDILRLLDMGHIALTTGALNEFDGCEAGSLALAVRGVIVVHGAIVVGTNAQYVQHVMIEIARVGTVNHKRFISRRISFSQGFGIAHRLLEVLFAEFSGLVNAHPVVGINGSKHRLVYGSQHFVATLHCIQLITAQAVDCGLQRVDRYGALLLGCSELRLKQMAVRSFASSLANYLRQHIKSCLRMVFLSRIIVLFPKRGVSVGSSSQRHKQHHKYRKDY